MSRGRAIEAGRAAVRFIGDRSQLQKAIRLAEQDLRAFGTQVGNIGRTLTAAAVATGSAFAIPVRDALRLQEALSGLDAAFGKEASAARGFLKELQTELKLSQRASVDALTGFQRFFRGMGFGEQDAAALSQRMTEIAADLSAAGDISFDESAGRIRSALTGSTTVLDQFGIALKQTEVEAEAMRQGINKSSGDLTSFERATINASLITKQFASNGILGAAKREANSAAGEVRALKNQMADLSATIGAALIPVIRPAVVYLQNVVTSFSQWTSENEKLFQSLAKTVVQVGALGVAMIAAGKAAQILAASIGAVRAASAIFANPLRLVVAAVLAVTAAVVASSKSLPEWARVARESFSRFVESFALVSQAINDLDIDRVFKIMALTIERELLELGQEFGNFGALVASIVDLAFTPLVTVLKLLRETFRLMVGTVKAVAEAFNLATEGSDGFFSSLSEKQKARIQEINEELQKLKTQLDDTGDADKPAAVATPATGQQLRRDAELRRALLLQNLSLENPNIATSFAPLNKVHASIARAINDDVTAIADVFRANVSLAKETAAGVVRAGKQFLAESELAVLQKKLANLQSRAFRIEVASSFNSTALQRAFGIGTGDVDEEQLEVQKEMAKLLQQIRDKQAGLLVQ